MLFLRALAAFLLLPGSFAGLLPALIVLNDPRRGTGNPLGWIPLIFGIAILLWCVRDFYVAGKGTLAPWDPPKHLVVVGLYHFVRNPMYVGIMLLLAGWSIVAGSPLLGGYTLLFTVAFHLRVVLYEEPRLRNQFAEDWTAYVNAVPRWFPRIRGKS